ncbi:hypothetical protein BL180_00029245, partial [Klebsiella pneumoniae]
SAGRAATTGRTGAVFNLQPPGCRGSRQQPDERSNHAAGRLLQAMVKALLGSERSMLSEICKISQSMQLNL